MTGYVRVRRRVLQSAVVRYRHGPSGRVVTLVGTMHAGERAYYERLHALVAGLAAAGATVLYEEGDGPAPGQAQAATASGQPAPGNPFSTAIPYRHWVRQPLRLGSPSAQRPKGVTFTAADWSAWVAGLGVQAQRPKAATRADDCPAWVAGLGVLTRLATLDRFGLMARMILGDKHREIILERNRAALAALPPEGDAVLVWGAAHLPGLGVSLRKAGFRRRSAEWVSIGTVPALWPSVGIIRRALRSQQARAC